MPESAEEPADISGRLVYSVEEAASLLGISRTFVFQLIAAGEIDSFKIGPRRKIPRDAVHGYLKRLRMEQSPSARQQLPGPEVR